MRGWSETDMEYRQRLTEEAWANYERMEHRDRLSGQPCRAYIPPTEKMVFDRVEGNWTFYKHIPIPK